MTTPHTTCRQWTLACVLLVALSTSHAWAQARQYSLKTVSERIGNGGADGEEPLVTGDAGFVDDVGHRGW
ncbi:MAG: hypothetical protein O2901_11940, partial [Verrucomicrobia bacterium]|nr:hypothetical protein [Verrucomicrobiota bacterium]